MALSVTPHGWSSGFSFVSEYRGRGPSFFPCTKAGRPFPIIEDLGNAVSSRNDCLGYGLGVECEMGSYLISWKVER